MSSKLTHTSSCTNPVTAELLDVCRREIKMKPNTELRIKIREKLEEFLNVELTDQELEGLFLPEDHPDFFYRYRKHLLNFQGMAVSLKIENTNHDSEHNLGI